MSDISTLILLTFTPALELRASIPYGIFSTSLPLISVFLICVIANILLAPLIYFLLNNVIHLFLEVKFINKIYQKTVNRAQKKVHQYVEKYGVFGLALFIAIPLPGSGVYTGALGAYILGFKFRDFIKAAVIGVLIAGVLVTLISILGNSALEFFIKKI